MKNIWLFKSNTELIIEDSISVDNNITKPTKQIVIKGVLSNKKVVEKWSLEKSKKYALISVFEKKNLSYLCSNLNKFNYSFVSSGSTGNKIRELGFKCKDVSKITNFKEMFGGRVKTLNSLIYSSLLYIRDDKIHKKQFELLKIPEIDIVCC